MSERRFGILIASCQFPEEAKLTPLRCPENDVDGLNEILASKDHGEFSEISVFKNSPHHEILRSINRVLRKATKDDLVLIYYSGHGKLNSANRLHLATVDTVLDELEATSIPVDTIRDYVDISPSNKVVLILDCCFSGAAGGAFARGGVDDQLQLASRGRGTYIMTASTGIQVAQEKECDQYGVFTKHIIKGIRDGEADLDADGHITMEELYHYVHDKVLEENFQEPMKWDLNVRGQLIIAHSGKIPWQERRRQIKKILSDLWEKGMIENDILVKAMEVIDLDPTRLSGVDREYNDVLEQLLQGRLEPVAFIRKWDKLSPDRQKSESPEPRPPGPWWKRKRNTLLMGAMIVLILAIVVRLIPWPSQEQKPPETRPSETPVAKAPEVHPKETPKPEVRPPEPPAVQPQPEAAAPGRPTFTNSIGMSFVLIPEGSFTMGSPVGEHGRDPNDAQHRVTIGRPFYLQTSEVTQKQWMQVMGNNPSLFKDCGEDCPVEMVSWNEAQEFITRLSQKEGGRGYRLPSEAEWEYACRAGSTGKYCFGDEYAVLGEYAWYNRNSGSKPHPVKQKKPNAWRLYDMHGNVEEWCQDWFGEYPTGPVRDPIGPVSGEKRVMRGGGWSDNDWQASSAHRSTFKPVDRNGGIGFRVARDL